MNSGSGITGHFGRTILALCGKNELENEMGRRWLHEIERLLPEGRDIRILDAGTGTGFFAILLAQAGYSVEGIDLTPAMLEEAGALAAQRGLDIVFREMDAQALSYEDASFDVVISRNLTWTLPEPEKAYREWFRVLKPGGVLMNFDADYAEKCTQPQRAEPQSAARQSIRPHRNDRRIAAGERRNNACRGRRTDAPGVGQADAA